MCSNGSEQGGTTDHTFAPVSMTQGISLDGRLLLCVEVDKQKKTLERWELEVEGRLDRI